jgi:hypothetical protein
MPVPPLATANVPLSVIAPVVAIEGVSPVVPPLKELTTAADAHAEPFETKAWPFDPGAIKLTAEVPFPAIKLFAVNVLLPVPPLEAFSVPDKVTTPVVEVEGVNPVDPALNELTAAVDVHVVPLDVITFPDAPGESPRTAPVPFPISAALDVSVVLPVPPFATGRVPATLVVRLQY